MATGGRGSIGWQTTLADLSLILFMVAVLALRGEDRPRSVAAPEPVPAPPVPRAEPLAVWIEAPGAPSLDEWIAATPQDPREQLTITARYAPGNEAEALVAASRLLRVAGRAGARARVILEPGSGALVAPPQAAFAFDEADGRAAVARALQERQATPPRPVRRPEGDAGRTLP